METCSEWLQKVSSFPGCQSTLDSLYIPHHLSHPYPLQPCPSPTMDLTLVSASKFVNSYCLAASQDHMVVVTKSTEHAQSTTNWLL